MFVSVNNIPISTQFDWKNERCIVKGLEATNVSYRNYNHSLCAIIGTIYDKKENVETINKRYRDGGYKSLSSVDGNFVYLEINPDGSCVIITDREGDIPIYYRSSKKDELIISSECSDLFYDFSYEKLNESAVNDFLRFGTLVGDETMHEDVHLLQGGSELLFSIDCGIRKTRHYRFHYEETSIAHDEIEELVYKAYLKGVAKRLEGRENDSCIFLSGGMDSRLLLAVANDITCNKVGAVTFGQKYSEEVNIARLCAQVRGNEFKWIQTNPVDFVINAEEYIKEVCCGDMFPQSYIINAVKQINKKAFATGFALDAYIGGTFLNQEAIDSTKNLSDFLKEHFSLLKMNVLSKEDLQELTREGRSSIFDIDNETVLHEANLWSGYSVKDSVQAFGIDNRAKRSVALRETTPGNYLQRINPSSDSDFLGFTSMIPADYRLNHQFYYSMFNRFAKEYASIPYNNTTLPVSCPIEMWKNGTANEINREKLYAQFMRIYNTKHYEKIYYPHFYSDFEGYSKYDQSWKGLFEKYLLNTDAVIYNMWFEKNKVDQMYFDHINHRKNNRKKIIFLTSLEIFLKNMLEN